MSILIFLLISTLQLHNLTSIECSKYLYRNDITQNIEDSVINYIEHLESQLRSQNKLNLNSMDIYIIAYLIEKIYLNKRHYQNAKPTVYWHLRQGR